ncbi:uncharacterized protein LOC118202125 [Stegodyphus dumicola]|uniref:uncharacterized protein LOC118202125 n=1 Tax=Stegodyphus dumicola TaxID=202533 RepID=UPI0015B3476E|nr:uncharacterized protein LOC118202125 [Stegodyphus dumicola]
MLLYQNTASREDKPHAFKCEDCSKFISEDLETVMPPGDSTDILVLDPVCFTSANVLDPDELKRLLKEVEYLEHTEANLKGTNLNIYGKKEFFFGCHRHQTHLFYSSEACVCLEASKKTLRFHECCEDIYKQRQFQKESI